MHRELIISRPASLCSTLISFTNHHSKRYPDMKTTYFANVITFLPLLVIAVLSLFFTEVGGQGFVCCTNPACQPARKGCNPW